MLDVSGIRANPLAAINTPGRGGEAAGEAVGEGGRGWSVCVWGGGVGGTTWSRAARRTRFPSCLADPAGRKGAWPRAVNRCEGGSVKLARTLLRGRSHTTEVVFFFCASKIKHPSKSQRNWRQRHRPAPPIPLALCDVTKGALSSCLPLASSFQTAGSRVYTERKH